MKKFYAFFIYEGGIALKWFNNLYIRWKLGIGFGIIILFSIGLAIFSVYTSDKINNDYVYVVNYPAERLSLAKDIDYEITFMRWIAIQTAMESGNADEVENLSAQFAASYDRTIAYIKEYVRLSNTDTRRDPSLLKARATAAENISVILSDYKMNVMEQAVRYAASGD